MPFRETMTAQFYDLEVLKFPAGLDAIKSVVIDSTTVTLKSATDPNARTVIPAGTILKKNATGKQVIPYDGSGSIQGILARSVDILSNNTSSFEPAPMFYHQCVFITNAIVGFTAYQAALVSALSTCKFEGK